LNFQEIIQLAGTGGGEHQDGKLQSSKVTINRAIEWRPQPVGAHFSAAEQRENG
jgi:hypothetical protein